MTLMEVIKLFYKLMVMLFNVKSMGNVLACHKRSIKVKSDMKEYILLYVRR